MKRLVIAGLTLAVGLGALAMQTVGAGASGAGAKAITPTAAPPSGVTITCTNVSGFIKENPGLTLAPVGPGGASIKWKLKAVATGCTSSANSAGVVLNIVGAIVTENGFIRDLSATSTCGAALGAPGTFGGVSGSKIQWIASPPLGNTVLPPGTLGVPATIDTIGLEIHWPIATGTSFDLGGDYPAVMPCPAGPLPSTSANFGTPSTHTPVFLATL